MTTTPVKHFFISYNKADRQWAEWIAWQLEQENYTTVLQAWDFRPGSNFGFDMQQATAHAERTIAVLSPDYLDSRFTQPEWFAAFAKDPTGEHGTLLPVRVRECKLEGLLPQIVRIDLVGVPEEDAKNALLAGVRRERAKPTAAPEFPRRALQRSVIKNPGFPGTLPNIWNIPHNRNPNFTGRVELLDALRSELASGRAAALTTQAIYGLGGVGKTQTAIEYAYRHQTDYDVVWWVRSEEPATLAADYAALAAELGLPEKNEPQQNLIVRAVRDWLGHNTGWLLIFDNATDRAVIRGYLPQSNTGHVIITSRSAHWQGVASPLHVKVMERAEAVDFLLNRTAQADRQTAALLAEALGYLPLALEQAGAYIEETGSTLAEYLDLLKPYWSKLMQRGTTATDYQATVATTWDISFQQVREKTTAAEDFMNLCAFFAPDDIPIKIITDGAKRLPETLAAAVADPLALDEIVAALRRYSLAEVDNDAISFHRLVQAVLRERLDEAAKKQWAEAAVNIVNDAFPFDSDDVRTWLECSSLLPHASTTMEYAEQFQVALGAVGRLLNQSGLYFKGRAEFAKAKIVFEKTLAIGETAYGANHPVVATRLNNLGLVLKALGDLEGARAHYERALAIDETAYGANHPEVATDLNNLGLVLQALGDLEGARAHLERALAILREFLVEEHPSVVTVRNNVARLDRR